MNFVCFFKKRQNYAFYLTKNWDEKLGEMIENDLWYPTFKRNFLNCDKVNIAGFIN